MGTKRVNDGKCYSKLGVEWVVRRLVLLILILILALHLSGCNTKTEETKNSSPKANLSEQKIYKLPKEKIKEQYNIEDFEAFYSQYLHLNNQVSETANESKTGMSEEEKSRYYRISDITPENIKNEIGCQIFKVNHTCETYVIYNGEFFRIGFGFGGFGVISLETCNFDKDEQTDLIYSFSWGSGLHRSHIGIFNLKDKKETWLDFVHLNEDITLQKLSDDRFNIYNCELELKEDLNYTQYKVKPKKILGELIAKNGNIQVEFELEEQR